MRFQMHWLGVDPLVVPNGLEPDAYRKPRADAVEAFEGLAADRTVLAKVARWDPGKHWMLAVEGIAELKRAGARPLLIARGGVEAYGMEVRRRATAIGLHVEERDAPGEHGERGLLRSLAEPGGADVVVLNRPLDGVATRLLFHGAGAVLANSLHEPFGLVGLETMAVGGLACAGATGEDYVVPGWSAVLLQSADPRELGAQLGAQLGRLRRHPEEERALRTNAAVTARAFAWPAVLSRFLFPLLGLGEPAAAASELRLGSHSSREEAPEAHAS